MFLSTFFAAGFFLGQMYPSPVASSLGILCQGGSDDTEQRVARLLYRATSLTIATRRLLELSALLETRQMVTGVKLDQSGGTFNFLNVSYGYTLGSTCYDECQEKWEGDGQRQDTASSSAVTVENKNTGREGGFVHVSEEPKENSSSPVLKPCGESRGESDASYCVDLTLRLLGDEADGWIRGRCDENVSKLTEFCGNIDRVLTYQIPAKGLVRMDTLNMLIYEGNGTKDALDTIEDIYCMELSRLDVDLIKFLTVNGRLGSVEITERTLMEVLAMEEWNGTKSLLATYPEVSRDFLWRTFDRKGRYGLYHSWQLNAASLLRQLKLSPESTPNMIFERLSLLACEVLKPICLIGELGALDLYSLYL